MLSHLLSRQVQLLLLLNGLKSECIADIVMNSYQIKHFDRWPYMVPFEMSEITMYASKLLLSNAFKICVTRSTRKIMAYCYLLMHFMCICVCFTLIFGRVITMHYFFYSPPVRQVHILVFYQ